MTQVINMPTPPNFKAKFQAVQDIKAGQDMFWYGFLPIGVAARKIEAGSFIKYDPLGNTEDVITIEERKNANPS